MLRDDTAAAQFSDFIREVEPRLRRALTAGFGSEVGREATAEALAYAWQHWERIKSMGNPAGYLYRVGQGKARRMRPLRVIADRSRFTSSDVWVEPALESALAGLTHQQRTVVALVHAFDWSFAEVANLMGVTKSTVQSYEKRAMEKLQRALGVRR